MPKDRDQLTPDDPEDRATLERSRGQGTGGTGYDLLPGEDADGPGLPADEDPTAPAGE